MAITLTINSLTFVAPSTIRINYTYSDSGSNPNSWFSGFLDSSGTYQCAGSGGLTPGTNDLDMTFDVGWFDTLYVTGYAYNDSESADTSPGQSVSVGYPAANDVTIGPMVVSGADVTVPLVVTSKRAADYPYISAVAVDDLNNYESITPDSMWSAAVNTTVYFSMLGGGSTWTFMLFADWNFLNYNAATENVSLPLEVANGAYYTTIVGGNTAPTVSIGTPTIDHLEVTVTVTDSDSDGTVTTRLIEWGDGNSEAYVSGTPISHTYATGGAKTITATATDNVGATATDTTTALTSDLVGPTIEITSMTASGLSVAVTATAEDDGTVTAFTIDWGDGGDPEAIVSGVETPHLYTSSGSHPLELSATDDDDITTTITDHINTTANPPTCLMTTESIVGLVVEVAVVYAAGDLALDTVTLDWDDGSEPETLTDAGIYTHEYALAGSYDAVLTAIDTEATSTTAELTLVVEEAEVPLTAAITAATVVLRSVSVTPTVSSVPDTLTIDWGDDTTESAVAGVPSTHYYSSGGLKVITVTAVLGEVESTATFSTTLIPDGPLQIKTSNGYRVVGDMDSAVYDPQLTGRALAAPHAHPGTMGFTVDGYGSAIATGAKKYLVLPHPITLTGWRILTDVPCTLACDLRLGDLPDYPLAPEASITGATPPTITEDDDAAGVVDDWTVDLSTGTIVSLVVTENDAATAMALILFYTPEESV